MNANEYKCQACGGVFEKGWSDEEATAELGETFPSFAPSDCGLVCDDCWQKHFALASDDTRPEGGDSTKIEAPFTGGAVGVAETPKPQSSSNHSIEIEE